MKLLKYLGFLSLMTSYIFLILSLIIDLSEISNFNLFNISWGVGILSLISNAIYAIKIQINECIFSVFGFCGLIWFGLPLVSESFGVVTLVIFFIIGIYIHLQPNTETERIA
jgi:hypothetical protein